MLYITATVEDLAAYEGLKCFSRAALAAMVDWYDENGIDQEADAAELRGDWMEYEDAGAMWRVHHRYAGLPAIYEPDQLEDLVDAIEAETGDVIQTEAGTWLVHED